MLDASQAASVSTGKLRRRAHNEVFASLVAGTVFSASVTRDDGAVVHGWGTAVSGEYFALFAKAPQVGRWLGPRDDRPEARPVAVLGHLFWQRAFGGDPDVVGRTVSLDGRDRFTVVGVAPPKFQGQGLTSSYYIPLAHAGPFIGGLDDREVPRVWGLGRLRCATSRILRFKATSVRELTEEAGRSPLSRLAEPTEIT